MLKVLRKSELVERKGPHKEFGNGSAWLPFVDAFLTPISGLET